MGTREDRIWRDLAEEPAAHVRTWLTVGLRRLADPQTSARERAAVAAHVAACQALLARAPIARADLVHGGMEWARNGRRGLIRQWGRSAVEGRPQ